MLRSGAATVALATTLLAAACGGAAARPTAVSPSPAASPDPPLATASAASAAPASSAAPQVAVAPAGPLLPAPVEMKPPVATAFGDSLRTIGLDPRVLPPLAKLEPRALRGVMKLFAKSLGATCGDCHEAGNFAAPTVRKAIATHMWDRFVARLSMAEGSPIFCDSCHQGRLEQLDRRDKKALSNWMDAHFVRGLARLDGQPNACETCHVDMEMHLFQAWVDEGHPH